MILSHPTAPDGQVSTLPSYSTEDFTSDSAILCRNTAPLITFAFALIRRNIGCRVLGREIGRGLVTLIEKLNATNLDSLETKLSAYESREVTKLRSKYEDSAADAIEDKCACIRSFISNIRETERTIRALCLKIESLFSDEGSAKGLLTLATIHKSKGLEWPTVFLLDRDLIPSKYAKGWQLTQEYHLHYVAITRAKLNFFYIKSGSWKKATIQASPNAPQSAIQAALFED